MTMACNCNGNAPVEEEEQFGIQQGNTCGVENDEVEDPEAEFPPGCDPTKENPDQCEDTTFEPPPLDIDTLYPCGVFDPSSEDDDDDDDDNDDGPGPDNINITINIGPGPDPLLYPPKDEYDTDTTDNPKLDDEITPPTTPDTINVTVTVNIDPDAIPEPPLEDEPIPVYEGGPFNEDDKPPNSGPAQPPPVDPAAIAIFEKPPAPAPAPTPAPAPAPTPTLVPGDVGYEPPRKIPKVEPEIEALIVPTNTAIRLIKQDDCTGDTPNIEELKQLVDTNLPILSAGGVEFPQPAYEPCPEPEPPKQESIPVIDGVVPNKPVNTGPVQQKPLPPPETIDQFASKDYKCDEDAPGTGVHRKEGRKQCDAVWYRVNQLRKTLGLRTLQWNDELASAAQSHAQDLYENSKSLGDPSRWHFGSDGKDPIQRAAEHGFTGYYIKENWSQVVGTPDQIIFTGGPNEEGKLTPGWTQDMEHWLNMVDKGSDRGGVGCYCGKTVFMAGQHHYQEEDNQNDDPDVPELEDTSLAQPPKEPEQEQTACLRDGSGQCIFEHQEGGVPLEEGEFHIGKPEDCNPDTNKDNNIAQAINQMRRDASMPQFDMDSQHSLKLKQAALNTAKDLCANYEYNKVDDEPGKRLNEVNYKPKDGQQPLSMVAYVQPQERLSDDFIQNMLNSGKSQLLSPYVQDLGVARAGNIIVIMAAQRDAHDQELIDSLRAEYAEIGPDAFEEKYGSGQNLDTVSPWPMALDCGYN